MPSVVDKRKVVGKGKVKKGKRGGKVPPEEKLTEEETNVALNELEKNNLSPEDLKKMQVGGKTHTKKGGFFENFKNWSANKWQTFKDSNPSFVRRINFVNAAQKYNTDNADANKTAFLETVKNIYNYESNSSLEKNDNVQQFDDIKSKLKKISETYDETNVDKYLLIGVGKIHAGPPLTEAPPPSTPVVTPSAPTPASTLSSSVALMDTDKVTKILAGTPPVPTDPAELESFILGLLALTDTSVSVTKTKHKEIVTAFKKLMEGKIDAAMSAIPMSGGGSSSSRKEVGRKK